MSRVLSHVVPASARPPSRSVRVNNLVRPFHEKALRALLSKTGTIEENGFWMDSIKTHCYVTVGRAATPILGAVQAGYAVDDGISAVSLILSGRA
jgi:hypothetical protein